jgi:hypothetical protein
VALMIMDHTMNTAIRGALPKSPTSVRLSWLRLRSISKGPLRLTLACS